MVRRFVVLVGGNIVVDALIGKTFGMTCTDTKTHYDFSLQQS